MSAAKSRKKHEPLTKNAKRVLKMIAGLALFVIVLGVTLAVLSYYKYI